MKKINNPEQIITSIYEERLQQIYQEIERNIEIKRNKKEETALYYKMKKRLRSKKQKYLLEELLDIINSNNSDFLEIFYKKGLKDGINLMHAAIQDN